MVDRERAMQLRLQGVSYRKIGDLLGVTGQRAQQITGPPPPIRAALKARSGCLCEDCGLPTTAGHAHHLTLPDSAEAYNDLANLRYLCLGCHRQAHNAYIKGTQIRNVRVTDRELSLLREKLPGISINRAVLIAVRAYLGLPTEETRHVRTF